MRLIGQRCKCGDTLSWLILIGRRFIHTRTDVHSNYFKEDKPSQSINCYSVFRERSLKKDLVTIPEWSHLFPSRTQKLSTPGPKIAMPAIVNRGRCRLPKFDLGIFLLLWLHRWECVYGIDLAEQAVKRFCHFLFSEFPGSGSLLCRIRCSCDEDYYYRRKMETAYYLDSDGT